MLFILGNIINFLIFSKIYNKRFAEEGIDINNEIPDYLLNKYKGKNIEQGLNNYYSLQNTTTGNKFWGLKKNYNILNATYTLVILLDLVSLFLSYVFNINFGFYLLIFTILYFTILITFNVFNSRKQSMFHLYVKYVLTNMHFFQTRNKTYEFMIATLPIQIMNFDEMKIKNQSCMISASGKIYKGKDLLFSLYEICSYKIEITKDIKTITLVTNNQTYISKFNFAELSKDPKERAEFRRKLWSSLHSIDYSCQVLCELMSQDDTNGEFKSINEIVI